MGCERHFFNPATPILDHAAQYLEKDWKSGPLDLRSTLLVVPTRHAGRRLRERLALDAAQRGAAVLAGPVWTPPRLFSPRPDSRRPVAADIVAQALWVLTLRSCEKSFLGQLVKPQSGQPGFQALAQHLTRLRDTLCEEGYTLETFARRVRDEHLGDEPERWTALAELERMYLQAVEQHGYRDDVTEKLAAAQSPEIPEGITRIVVLFVTDSPPLSLIALERLAGSLPVDICIHADSLDSDAFDAWGRPRADKWMERSLPVEAKQIEVCDDAIAMAERVRCHLASLSREARSLCTISATDPLHAEVIETTLARDNIPVFNPAGRSALRFPLYTLIRDLLELHLGRSYAAFAKLARHPYARARLEPIAGDTDLLSALDDFQNAHLPTTIDAAESLATAASKSGEGWRGETPEDAVGAVIREVKKWLDSFDAQNQQSPRLSVALPLALQKILQNTRVDEELKEARKSFFDALDILQTIEPWCSSLVEQCGWLLEIMATQSSHKPRAPEAIELLGWLELAWEDAPILLLTDMNDGLVPETIAPNPFLPDNLRRAAGLRGNDHRFARDAFVLESLIRCRAPENVRFIVPRRTSDGNPLKPSRLLLQRPLKELAPRALLLFRDPPLPSVAVRRTHGWIFKPPLPPQPFPVPLIYVTSLRTYLADPFMFYLQYILKIAEPFEPAFEIDDLLFGRLCHEILRRFAASDFRNSRDEEEIRAYLLRETQAIFAREFGSQPPAPVLVQKDLVHRRMVAFASVQARLRADGWEIVAQEHPVRLTLDGVELIGRIDRVDWHPDLKLYRILDYKTARDSKDPSQTHLKRMAQSTNALWFAQTGDGNACWTDLQLPLYAKAWQDTHNPDATIETAYFALPDDTRDTAVLTWKEGTWSQNTVLEAVHCAERIIRRMKAGVFWPSASKTAEPFDRLFGDDVLANLSDDFRNEMERRATEYDRRAAEGVP